MRESVMQKCTYHKVSSVLIVLLVAPAILRVLVLFLSSMSNFTDCSGDVLVELAVVILLVHVIRIFFQFSSHLSGILRRLIKSLVSPLFGSLE